MTWGRRPDFLRAEALRGRNSAAEGCASRPEPARCRRVTSLSQPLAGGHSSGDALRPASSVTSSQRGCMCSMGGPPSRERAGARPRSPGAPLLAKPRGEHELGTRPAISEFRCVRRASSGVFGVPVFAGNQGRAPTASHNPRSTRSRCPRLAELVHLAAPMPAATPADDRSGARSVHTEVAGACLSRESAGSPPVSSRIVLSRSIAALGFSPF